VTLNNSDQGVSTVRNKITIMDGGLGAELKAMGAPFRKPEWSALALMGSPESVRTAHQNFVDAGAEVLITNTYAICPFHIGRDVFDKRALELTELATNIAREVADNAPHSVAVAGCLPPVFGSYRPDLFDAATAKDLYAPLIAGQKDKVDFWIAETMASTQEASFVCEMLKTTDLPIWLAYTLSDELHDGEACLRSGETVQNAVKEALASNVNALLFNCSQPEVMEAALKVISDMNISIPFGVYANTFPKKPKQYLANDSSRKVEMREEITPEVYLRFAKKWAACGATIIGGCCGIGPEHIKLLHALND
tara:strand:- start:53118 stop:54044 length:927 start_codon:yes stop_codon:yes gene_type:complete